MTRMIIKAPMPVKNQTHIEIFPGSSGKIALKESSSLLLRGVEEVKEANSVIPLISESFSLFILSSRVCKASVNVFVALRFSQTAVPVEFNIVKRHVLFYFGFGLMFLRYV